jgi:hypothetical protein
MGSSPSSFDSRDSSPASFDSRDSSFDFSAFVAASRGISSREAQRLLEEWLEKYEPSTTRTSRFVERDPAQL